MPGISDRELLESIQEGFDRAYRATGTVLDVKSGIGGSGRLSAKFVYEVASAVHRCLMPRSPGLCLRVIEVGELGERKSGEWLVDACITEEHRESESLSFIDRVVFAMESESDTGKRAFHDDFAKLVHLNAEYKLYLNGLSQTTCRGMRKYMNSRCEYVESVLNRIRPTGEFFLRFWPSPGKPRTSRSTVDSIWRGLQRGEWSHLNGVRLRRFDQGAGKLIEVRP